MKNKKIVVIIGHPDAESFSGALSRAYIEGASSNSAQVRCLDLSQLSFEPILKYGYRKRMELEEDLKQAQEWIRWADHLVIVYPTWWGTMPAILKGFFDRTFLPGFAYRYRDNSPLWDKLLTGKTARLIVTSDTPKWYNRLIYRQAGHLVMRRNILGFCGIKTVGITDITPVSSSSEQQRGNWLRLVKRLGEKLA
ncbi:flavodoxin family protein [Xylanibacillus composti]|uniref:NAD(P)H dehydrogenase (Quinone) n=1 Tax=Xylanibacillus composti TaxID=1572762 RepID=A0A8J4H2B3_9BACL|nr:NAD(P)H-dependent oxidoreductase [Xylanibacillus composti]MDT9724892.1 flavodoxin family protein [Xylanibacillus composti]GIQ68126.1 NAD(P)H dehydrogenase (quinone) [Xylanibacillus composti]